MGYGQSNMAQGSRLAFYQLSKATQDYQAVLFQTKAENPILRSTQLEFDQDSFDVTELTFDQIFRNIFQTKGNVFFLLP